MKIFLIIVLIILVIWSLYSWLSIRKIEEPKYSVLSENNIYEIRVYEPYIIAETIVSGTYRNALNKGFRNIADYIFGNNTSSKKIAMTAPVLDETKNANSEKIAMTVPVLEEGNDSERKISFIMPSEYTLENIPKPNSDLVKLREIPERKVAVLQYGWYTNEKRVKDKTEYLLNKLEQDGINTIGETSSAQYNPPLSMPFFLRNEIIVEIK